MGVGSAPPAWGPDRPHDTGTVAAVPGDEHAGTSWLRLAAVVATVAAVLLALIVVFSLGRDKGGSAEPNGRRPSAGSSRTAPRPITPAAVRDFDPEQVGGAPEENPQEVPLATDRKPSTAWTTVRYNDGPVLAPYKGGVGLLIDLGEEKAVRGVTVSLVGAPYDLKLLAAPKGASAAPTSVQGLTTVDSHEGAAGDVRLTGAEPVTTRYLVVWLTALPPVSGGYRGGIAELSVRS
jgi:putative peptidoglycan lipid II flippase